MSDKIAIQVTENGPYQVTGADSITIKTITANAEGESWDYTDGKTFQLDPKGSFLCRCGHSAHKPFCDGTHAKVHFNGKETASNQPYLQAADRQDGPLATLTDQENLCAYGRFCDARGQIWNLAVSDSPADVKLAMREASHCPSGRLKVWDVDMSKQLNEEPNTPELSLLEDPQMHCSAAIWAKGGVEVTSSKGEAYEVRERMTLCRCGNSSNKPFCDGSHASSKWKDGLA
ncbi:MAG: CDGSH iron-sulfur domain-containing protein [Thiolinea sp.]